MPINASVVTRLLVNTFDPNNAAEIKSPVNEEERNLHDLLAEIMRQCITSSEVNVHEEVTLHFDDDFDITPEGIEYEDSQFIPDVLDSIHEQKEVDLKYKQEAVKFWLSGRRKPYSLNTVKHRFRQVNDLKQLRRWEQQVEAGGNRYEKLREISEFVLNKLKGAIESKLTIHDIDLKRWALQRKAEINISSFKASHRWIQDLKKKHRIVSRKITKFVTKASSINVNDLEDKCESFRTQVKQSLMRYGAENVFNSDQSGFNLEIRSGRTLHYKGIKGVESIVQSLSSLTHSYSIQTTISAEGKLLSSLFLVLKEASGDFGPRVRQTLFTPENIIIRASKSGKLSKELLQTWMKEVYLKGSNNSSVLLLDSWSGQCNRTVQEVVPNEVNLKLMTIPPGTTSKIQPLDVYGFRFWKNFVRKLSDIIVLMDYDVNLHERNNIIKMQSLVHNQLSSPRFQDTFKYSWFKSGYITERPPEFINPVEFCFNTGAEPICIYQDNVGIITCGWCKKQLCLNHFFKDYHYCKDHVL